tara:strand:- start:156 stop:551 length:396 start_codon:yes stop_codon:yes gene_type:complete
MKTQLLCTFTSTDEYSDVVNELVNFYDILFGKVYTLQNIDDLDSLMLTYNIDPSTVNGNMFYEDTISVHRKKDTNTLYTINSLNALIKDLNGGVIDHNYSVDWNQYKNCILLTDETSYRMVSTKLFKIIKV